MSKEDIQSVISLDMKIEEDEDTEENEAIAVYQGDLRKQVTYHDLTDSSDRSKDRSRLKKNLSSSKKQLGLVQAIQTPEQQSKLAKGSRRFSQDTESMHVENNPSTIKGSYTQTELRERRPPALTLMKRPSSKQSSRKLSQRLHLHKNSQILM